MNRFPANIESHQSYLAEDIVTAFASLFRGLPDAWGTITGQCVKEKVTLEHYRRHLYGKVSLGVYPLRRDGQCRWFAIDDDHDDLHEAIAVIEHLVAIGFNRGVYIERSKSKGYHIFGFISDWTSARDVRRIAQAAICKAGLPATTEVFPKQDSADGVRYGNYLNLPYFGSANADGRRMILDLKSLRPMTLREWLKVVEPFPVAALPMVLQNFAKGDAKGKQGITRDEMVGMLRCPLKVGERRPTLVRLAGYLRFRGIPEEIAVGLLLPWAEKCFKEPLPPEELERHIRGIYGRYGVRERRVAKHGEAWHAEVSL